MEKMTAYELAEIMTVHDGSQVWEHGLEIAEMLKKQADQIKELEKINRELLNGNQNQAYLLRGSNLNRRL